MTLRSLFLFVVLAAILQPAAVSQRPLEGSPRDGRSEAQQGIFIQARNFTSETPGKSKLIVFYRIPENFFVAVRNPSGTPMPSLVRRPEISIEVVDKKGSAVVRDLRRNDIGAGEDTTETPDRKSMEGAFQFDTAPGEYMITFEVNDRESSRRYVDNKRKIVIHDFSKPEMAFSDALFLKPPDNSPLAPVNYGGDVPFGRNTSAYVEIAGQPLTGGVPLSAKIIAIDSNNHLPPDSDKLVSVLAMGQVELEMIKDSVSRFRLKPNLVAPPAYFVHMRTESLREGEYRLDLLAANGHDTAKSTQTFHIRWFDKPFSLRNLERAIKALRYIASDDEIDKIRHAHGDEQKRLFDDFWKKRDATPGTAFNEVMAEYYRRADYAASHFGTLRNADGLESDRGKTYVLFGPPTRVSRELKPSTPPREVWDYDSLKKRLIFVDESRRGEYVLLTSEER